VFDRPKMVHPKPFWPRIWRPLKILPPKGGEDTSETQLYHRANFHADRPHRRRDICPHAHKSRVTADDNDHSQQLQRLTWIADELYRQLHDDTAARVARYKPSPIYSHW